ncbi:YbaB/EbfC family nucleoid-associated protein [Kibdelosporangium philippinense]|uniref:YbaB/EbfC family nucleoid-associated protein n=1 Tax=Kibdelosporangium philippinense TaxID=211113 RepID=A0ABS8Z1E5_9PSEU|nr:YbaB/EbfC family nucleoid-associated protein [Kibdelosporangium philippinense]MCE7001590.1 YbaB/EbfC family nucleoid-associated protein [Kibdelosporangium philippinense]
MTEWSERLARRIESIDQAAADNRMRAEAYRQMTEELKGVDGTATSPDGMVTVVAGAGGSVQSITFSDATRSTDPALLSKTVMHTIARAQANAARAQAEVVRRGLGGSELLDRVLAEEETVFGDRPTPDPGPGSLRRAPAPAPAPTRPGYDDYEDGFDIYQGMRR